MGHPLTRRCWWSGKWVLGGAPAPYNGLMSSAVLAYADQNFLSKCVTNSEWRDQVLRLNQAEKVKLVLSPLHFYELGNASDEVREKIICLLEAVRPRWIHDRWNLQKQELLAVWDVIYNSAEFRYPATVSYYEAFISRGDLQRPSSLREVVADYRSAEGRTTFLEMFIEQEAIAFNTTLSYRAGRFTVRLLHSVDQTHIASQFAKVEGLLYKHDLLRRSAELLEDPLLRTMIDAFLYWGCKRYLKAWRAEEFFAAHLQKTGAKLGANNNVDRQHAIVAMTYCDLFITDDKKLAKRCEELRLNLNRGCARVMNGASFMEMLASA